MRSWLAAVLAVGLVVGLSVAGDGSAGAANTTGTSNPVTLSPAPHARPSAGVLAARRAMFDPKAPNTSSRGANAQQSRVTVSPTAPSGSLFTALSPVRVLDTRTATGGIGHPVTAGQTVLLNLSGLVPANTTAVVLNVTGADVTQTTYVTVWPDGVNRPTTSNLNLVAGQIRANAATVALAPDHELDLYNAHGSVDLVADLAGYYAPGTGAGFTAVSPRRMLDTRPNSAVGAGRTAVVDLSGVVPAAATAVTVNLTGLDATGGTYVTAYPDGTARPGTSSLNLARGDTTPNQVTVALGADRRIDLYNSVGSVDLVVDLVGYYATGTGNPFFQLAPDRAMDTRYQSPIGPNAYGSLGLLPWLPNTAAAVTFNLTGVNPTGFTYVTAWPTGQARPLASNLNLVPGQTAANQVTVALGSGSVSLYNRQGNTDMIMDLAGYFAPAPAACTTGCLYSWGDDIAGQLGNGTTGVSSATPGQVIGLSNVTAVTGGLYDGYALVASAINDWGDNYSYELGDNVTYGNSTTPQAVGNALSGVTQMAAGSLTGYALAGGQVWSWGYNGDGELGVGESNSGYGYYPVQVHLPQSEVGAITQIASGYNNAYALGQDGTVWAWGANGGSLGNGTYGTGCDTTPVGAGCMATTPVQVPHLTGVVAIAADWNDTFAIKSDGSVWAWGWNAEGELGLGTAGGQGCYSNMNLPDCMALSPVQVPALTGVTKIVGGLSTAYAVRSDGSVVSWGWNGQGELGNGTIGGSGCVNNVTLANCYAATPVVVTGLSGIKAIAAGAAFAEVLNADGTVSTWGDDTYGQLGGANATDVPTLVAGLSGVTTIGAGPYAAYAVVASP